ncbi:MAG TPA: VIT1/CCC1 transporter family protein [Vicinamibacterales bacterium]|nr:VIT1/CCC1 transporter family protein [Vicinamibacterales bacterium]
MASLSRFRRVLDPLERTSEILFGVIMVLTFTTSISVAEGGEAETRTILAGAIACNLAWGVVDAAMYLLASFMTRARNLTTLRAVRGTSDQEVAHRLILDALPLAVAAELAPPEVETLRRRLVAQPEPDPVRLEIREFLAATAIFLLVFLSTLPIVVPFLILDDVQTALRTSNAIAGVMLFLTGWSLGNHAGRQGWRTGLGMVVAGAVLVAITIALGG